MTLRCLAVVCLLCVPAVAAAQSEQTAPELTEAERAAYLASYQRGQGLFAERQYREALTELESARALLEHPNVLYAIALTLIELHRYLEAITVLERHLELSASGEARTRGALEHARAQLATLRVQLEPGDAELVVDGRSIEGTGAVREVRLDPGDHAVEARASGHAVAAAEARLDAGGTAELTLSLEPIVVPAPEALSQPPPDLAANTTRVVDVGDDRAAGPSGADPTAGAVLLAVGGAVFIGGGVTAIVGAADYAQFSDPERGTAWADVADSYHRAQPLVIAGPIVAGVGLATALVGVVLLTRTPDEETTIAIGPSRVELRGQF